MGIPLGGEFFWPVGLKFLVALALGLLVGLEREGQRAKNIRLWLGGVRTFPIISLYGFACAWLYQLGVTAALPLGMLSVAALAAVEYVEKMRAGHPGATSELSALLMFVVGAMTLLADIRVALALGVVNTLLLSEKAHLEGLVEKLTKDEFLAVVRFLLVTVIILPVLPDEEFTRYRLNPAAIWKIVVLVSSVGFVGYFLTKRFGSRVGLWLSGLMGGIVSSTAVSVAAGRMAGGNPALAAGALQATLLASSVMYVRVGVLIAVLNLELARQIWLLLAILAGVGLVLALTVGRRSAPSPEGTTVATGQNPFEIRTALVFAILFVALTVLTGLVQTQFGGAGVLTLAGLVGTVDVDPFILSLARTHTAGSEVPAMVVALMSNTVMKGVYFSAQAGTVRRAGALRYILWALLHLPLIYFWIHWVR